MTTETRPTPLPGPWQTARVLAVHAENATTKSFGLRLSRPTAYLPGQHFVLRLTAPDGYTAARSYSAASAPHPEGDLLELTVERLPDGEVSAFLHDVVEAGDELEVRGPIGGHFAWRGEAPALLIGGGTGIVPLMSMLRHARRVHRPDLMHLVASVRSPADLLYAAELDGPEATVVYTRDAPPGAGRPAGRLGPEDLSPFVRPDLDVFVCGSSAFCDHATTLAADLGATPARIRVERFGPTA